MRIAALVLGLLCAACHEPTAPVQCGPVQRVAFVQGVDTVWASIQYCR